MDHPHAEPSIEPVRRSTPATSFVTPVDAPADPPTDSRSGPRQDQRTAAQVEPAVNPHKGRTGFDRLMRAAGYSMEGLRSCYRIESAFRQEFWTAVVLLPAALWVGRTWVEVALLGGSVMLLLIVELLNSGIEAAIDRVSMDLHPLSKQAKDYASAAVFLTVCTCGAIWIAALWSRWGH